MRPLTISLLVLILATPAQAYYYPYYYPPVQVIEKITLVTNLVTVPTPVALFQVTPQAISTPPPVYIAVKAPAAAKADPCCVSPELTARLARIEQALAGLQPTGGPPMLSGGPPRLRTAAQPPPAPQAPSVKLGPETGPALALLRTRCAECHTAPGRKGVVLFNALGEWEPNVSKSEILAAVKPYKDNAGATRAPRMPKGRPGGMAAEEVALLERWARAD